MAKMVADVDLRGSWVTVNKGEEFSCDDERAVALVEAGAAHFVSARAQRKVEKAIAREATERAVDEPEEEEVIAADVFDCLKKKIQPSG